MQVYRKERAGIAHDSKESPTKTLRRIIHSRVSLRQYASLRGEGMPSVIYWLGGGGMTHFRPCFRIGNAPLPPPLPSPDPPVHIVLRIAKRIADWICNPM